MDHSEDALSLKASDHVLSARYVMESTYLQLATSVKFEAPLSICQQRPGNGMTLVLAIGTL